MQCFSEGREAPARQSWNEDGHEAGAVFRQTNVKLVRRDLMVMAIVIVSLLVESLQEPLQGSLQGSLRFSTGSCAALFGGFHEGFPYTIPIRIPYRISIRICFEWGSLLDSVFFLRFLALSLRS